MTDNVTDGVRAEERENIHTPFRPDSWAARYTRSVGIAAFDDGRRAGDPPTEDEVTSKLNAKSEEEAVRGFYTHLTIYVIVNGSLLALNLLAGGPAWVVWPLIGWGIGVVAHGIAVFLGKPHGPDGGRLTGL